MKERVFAIVVTYKPNIEELITNLNILELQVDKIVICNNFNEKLHLANKNYKIIELGFNRGIAEAQDIGMGWCFENGAEMVLHMDQDSSPDIKMVEVLIKDYHSLVESGYKVGLIGPVDFDKSTGVKNTARINKGKVTPENENISLVDSTLSSGSLIPKAVYTAIGGPEKGLFIDAVDSEYCWRMKKAGFSVFRDGNALLSHQLGEGKKKILGFIDVGVPAPIRHYYAFRNTIILVKRSYVPSFWKISSSLKILFKIVVYPFFLDDGKLRFKYMRKGLIDGFSNKSGRFD